MYRNVSLFNAILTVNVFNVQWKRETIIIIMHGAWRFGTSRNENQSRTKCICYMNKFTRNSFILIKKKTYLLGVHCLVSLLNSWFIFIRFRSNFNSEIARGINKSCNKIKCYTIFKHAIWSLSFYNIPKCATELIDDRNLDGETLTVQLNNKIKENKIL